MPPWSPAGVAVPLVGGTLASAFWLLCRGQLPSSIVPCCRHDHDGYQRVSITAATLQSWAISGRAFSAPPSSVPPSLMMLIGIVVSPAYWALGTARVWAARSLIRRRTLITAGAVAHFVTTLLTKRNHLLGHHREHGCSCFITACCIAEEYFGCRYHRRPYRRYRPAVHGRCPQRGAPRISAELYHFCISIGLKTDISGLTPEIFRSVACFVTVLSLIIRPLRQHPPIRLQDRPADEPAAR